MQLLNVKIIGSKKCKKKTMAPKNRLAYHARLRKYLNPAISTDSFMPGCTVQPAQMLVIYKQYNAYIFLCNSGGTV